MPEMTADNNEPKAKSKRHAKVLRLQILKPADNRSWAELAKLLRDVRYRVFRLANLAVSENYLSFHLWRTGRQEEFKQRTINKLNAELRTFLKDEGANDEDLNRFSATGAVPDTICGALSQYKIRAITSPNKWRDVIKGKAALPTFRLNMSIPVRCDKPVQRRLERVNGNDVAVELMVCRKPYPSVFLKTGNIGGGARAVLDRLLANDSQSLDGYRQRCFEIKEDERDHSWWLYVTYEFPASPAPVISKDVIVGVDLGVACPLYAAINNGHARLGRRQFAALAARIRSLQTQVMTRRRSLLRGGKANLSGETSRSGHGRRRKLRPIEILEGRIHQAYTTLNHQLSKAVIDFAKNHGAGVVQAEDLSGLREVLTGTFLGERWRYHQLQEFLKYKAREAGIEFRKVNPRFTSRRCSACGYIHTTFDRAHRDANRTAGFSARFQCPQCQYEADADYNAARNLATLDIEQQIAKQSAQQGLT